MTNMINLINLNALDFGNRNKLDDQSQLKTPINIAQYICFVFFETCPDQA